MEGWGGGGGGYRCWLLTGLAVIWVKWISSGVGEISGNVGNRYVLLLMYWELTKCMWVSGLVDLERNGAQVELID